MEKIYHSDKNIKRSLFLVFIIGISLVSYGKKKESGLHSIVEIGAQLKQVASNFQFTEGPALDKWGNVYFTDQPSNRILKWSTANKLTTFHSDAGRANGLYIDFNGDLLACADLNNELWTIRQDGTHTVILKDYEGKKFNGPNDLWLDKKGGIYFTDPYYKRPYWHRGDKEMEEHVYYLHPDRKTLIRVADDLEKPNGIIGTPNNKMLYVADIKANKTYRYKINKNGTLSNKTLFAPMGSDGMTIDNKGNVYLTGKGVTIFNKKGEQIGHIGIPEDWTANVTFGGRDQNILFITSMTSLYTIQTKVKGVRTLKR